MKAEQNLLTKREVLFKAALHEFGEKSYEEASLNAILEHANVSKGAFYYSFKDKKDLYTQLIAHIGEQKVKFFTEQSGSETFMQPDEVNIFTYLKSLTFLGIQFSREFPEFYKFNIKFTEESESFRKEILGTDSLNTDTYLLPMIKKAIQNGDIDSSYAPEFAEKIFNYMMVNYINIVGFEEITDLDKCLEELRLFYTFLEKGLGRH